MDQSALTTTQRTLLEELGTTKLAEAFYLAGGTGLAMHMAHRPSEDFDFFSDFPFDVEKHHQLVAHHLPNQLVLADRQTLIVKIQGVQVSFMSYPYQTLLPPRTLQPGISVASIQDIGTMKLSTIAARGAKRDFIDLYFICLTGLSLNQLIEMYEKRFASSAADRYHLMRSLTYFVDAEDDPTPTMNKPAAWADVKSYFVAEVRKLVGK